jgi:hypothetical protein
MKIYYLGNPGGTVTFRTSAGSVRTLELLGLHRNTKSYWLDVQWGIGMPSRFNLETGKKMGTGRGHCLWFIDERERRALLAAAKDLAYPKTLDVCGLCSRSLVNGRCQNCQAIEERRA